MTLQASGPISLGDVLNELRATNPNRGYPISLGDSDVLALAGKSAPPISLSDLYGRSTIAPLTATGNNDYAFANSAYNGGTIYCYPSVTVSGGAGNRRFTWSILSTTSAVSLDGADTGRCTVSRTFTKQSQFAITTYLRCVVADDSGSVTVDNIVAQLEWEPAL